MNIAITTKEQNYIMNSDDGTLTILKDDVVTVKKNQHSLILHNDDVNSFEHVIKCLREYCQHTPEQAYQCALITNTKGKCCIKGGSYKKLVPIKDALQESYLTCTIE